MAHNKLLCRSHYRVLDTVEDFRMVLACEWPSPPMTLGCSSLDIHLVCSLTGFITYPVSPY